MAWMYSLPELRKKKINLLRRMQKIKNTFTKPKITSEQTNK